HLYWTVITLPIVIIPLVFYSIGFAWLISALGVFFRDIDQVIGVIMSMLLFISPVFFSYEMAPEFAKQLLAFNPLTYPIEEVRRVVVLGLMPQWNLWIMNMMASLFVAWSGLWVFERAKPAFADVV
ncbi:MAG: ABC transporter permease, partial [Gammaproteobacteria bacterium]|nr:ABC transporter permease [Gammaproteobacteria bacterium]